MWILGGCLKRFVDEVVCFSVRQLQPGSAGRVLAVPADAVLFDLLSTKRLDHASERVRAEYAGGHTPDHADSGRNSITFNFLICDQQHQQRFDAKETSSTPFQLMRSCTTKKKRKEECLERFSSKVANWARILPRKV